jgi:hypothetical protein
VCDDPLGMSRRTKCTPAERAAEYLERIAGLTGAKQDDDGPYHLTAGGTHFLVDYKFVCVICLIPRARK